MVRLFWIWILSGLTISQVHGQDTLQTLNLQQYLTMVKEHHPLAQVVSNRIAMADFFIRQSKGAFDPLLMSGLDQKYFDGKTYFSTISSGLKIPTRIGWDVKIMGDWNRGLFLNPESNVPDAGLTYLGVEVPLGRGMFTDEQRTQLKRAKVALQMSKNEQIIALNDLLFEAGQSFIFLQEQLAQLDLSKQMVELAATRLEQIRTNEQIGERAAIDTMEASALYLLRQVDLEQRTLLVQNAYLQVNQYLWSQGTIPLQLDSSLNISRLELLPPTLSSLDTTANPYLQVYNLKSTDLQLERKLKIEQLKPYFNVNYNLLQTPNQLISTQFSFSNYKWGARLYFPILLRKERSSLSITGLKIANNALEQSNKQREVETKLKQIQNEWSTAYVQATQSASIANRYKELSEAEVRLFDLGESSLFMINAREMSYNAASVKYLEFLSKVNKSLLTEKFVLGKLHE